MKINGNEIRPGNVINHKDALWRAVKCQAVKPGKGGAFNQVELKDIRVGTKLNERFRASETVERVTLEQKEYQYLYGDGDLLTFMDNDTYEQIEANRSMLLEEQAPFLTDGITVTIESFEGEVLGITLPQNMTFEISEADAVVKGQTQSSSYKPAILENGVKVLVPPHIAAGTRIVINTFEGTYVERAKD
ncbi:elongation factor P [Terasakiella pusilla]|jgi:elongation factor P|uniref:elongation factor P n=1 Tax=Terasakiella pusilla TaxID=64973 RepID=UPI00048DFCEE|nr:elongation factor P [Terasakiella pusilla]